MKSLDLWNKLISNPENKLEKDKLYPAEKIKIKTKNNKTLTIDYLEKHDDNVTIYYHNPKFYGRFN